MHSHESHLQLALINNDCQAQSSFQDMTNCCLYLTQTFLIISYGLSSLGKLSRPTKLLVVFSRKLQ